MANQPNGSKPGQQVVKVLIWMIAFGVAYFISRTLMAYLR